MGSTCRKVLVVFAATLAFGAVASASASAGEWHVGGKALTGSATLAEAVKVEESIAFDFVVLNNAKVTCSSSYLYGKGEEAPEILAPASLKIRSLVLEGCAVTGDPNCSVPSTLTTDPLELKLADTVPPIDKAELKAQHGNVLFVIDFEGSQCPVAGEKAIGGKFTLNLPTGGEEQVEQTFVAQGSKESPAGTEWLGSPIYLSGKLKLKLASGSKWSFF
jgi:hypothetical protein